MTISPVLRAIPKAVLATAAVAALALSLPLSASADQGTVTVSYLTDVKQGKSTEGARYGLPSAADHRGYEAGWLQEWITSSGQRLSAYCMDRKHDQKGELNYSGCSWDDQQDQQRLNNILGVLRSGYPQKSLAELSTLAGAPVSEKVAITATNFAVWYYSNPEEAGDSFPKPTCQAPGGGTICTPINTQNFPDGPAIQQLYAAIVADAQSAVAEPTPVLELAGPTQGDYAKPIGPFTVATSASEITLNAPDALAIVDANGKPAGPVLHHGDTFYIKAQADTPIGDYEVKATATQATVLPGQVLCQAGKQTIVVAEATKVGNVSVSIRLELKEGPTPPPTPPTTATTTTPPVKTDTPSPTPTPTEADFSETPSPSPSEMDATPAAAPAKGDLARTGSSGLPAAASIAVALVAIGAASWILGKRRARID